MLISTLALLTLFPAILILAVGSWVVRIFKPQDRILGWALYCLGIALLLAPAALITWGVLRPNQPGFLQLLLLPSLVGLLAVLFYHIRDLVALWMRMKVLVSALVLALLGVIALSGLLNPFLPVLILLAALLVAGLWGLCRRVSKTLLILGGLLVLGLLAMDTLGLFANPAVYSIELLRGAYQALNTAAVLPGLALVVAAASLERGFKALSEGEEPYSTFILAGLLFLGVCAALFKEGLLVNATAHPLEDYLPFAALALVLVTGMLLYVLLYRVKRAPLAVVYLVLMPVLLLVSYFAAWTFDPHAITEKQAGRIQEAIEEYSLMANVYPDELGGISPNYLFFIPPPLTARGTVWCYQGGKDYYRLGYVTYQHAPSAGEAGGLAEIITHRAVGALPDQAWNCDQQLELIQQTGGM